MKTNGLKWFFVGAITVTASLSVLAAVNIPNSFTAGQPIKAADINANFTSLKTFVDTLEGTLTAHNHFGQTWTGSGGIGLKVTTTVGSAALYGENQSDVGGNGVEGKASGSQSAGVRGTSPFGVGVWGTSTSGNGGYFETTSSTFPALAIRQFGTNNIIDAYGLSDSVPVFSVTKDGGGKFTSTNSAALSAESAQSTAIIATSGGSGVSALIVNQKGNGNIILGRNAANAEVFRVTNNGSVQVQGVTLTSDRNAKHNFSSVNSLSILEKVSRLPISSWNYKTDADGLRHIGPMAQDFHAAFNLNGSDDKHISVVDESGVALAAIQGLNQKLETENAALKTQLAALEMRLTALEHK